MALTFQSLLDDFIAHRDAEYADEEHDGEARLDNLESTMQAMLELLRDKID